MAHMWADCLHNPGVWGVPNASERGTKSNVSHMWADWLHNPCLVAPNASKRGTKSAVTHEWADWLHNPCRLEGAQCFTTGDKICSGLQVARLATCIFSNKIVQFFFAVKSWNFLW